MVGTAWLTHHYVRMGQILQSVPSFVAASEGHNIGFVGLAVYTVLLIVILFAILAKAKQGFGSKVFRQPLSQSAEQLYLFIENMCVGIIGSHGRKYVPMIITFWLVIFFGNLIALFFPFAPTADLSFNLGMALISIGYVQYEGIKANGFVGHFSHFAGPKLGIAMIPITLMIFVIEIVSELMKNVSLSLRLYGNIHGGHAAVEAMNEVTQGAYIPLGAFLLPVKLLTVIVQAMIFSLLTCVYLSLVTGHHEEHEEGHSHGGEHNLEPAGAH